MRWFVRSITALAVAVLVAAGASAQAPIARRIRCPLAPQLRGGAFCAPRHATCSTRDEAGHREDYVCESFCGHPAQWCRQPCNGPPCAESVGVRR